MAEGLGYSEYSKLLIIHADDAGLSSSENRATRSVLLSGVVNSYSLMVTCPWFYEMALFAKNNPQYDHGIHLTFTCEWETYKFGPVLSPKEVPSLVDKRGFFFSNRNDLSKRAKIEDLRKEMVAQINTVLSYGLKPSHIDCHMYSVGARSDFLELYKEIGRIYKLPVLLNHKMIDDFSTHQISDQENDLDFYMDHVHLGNWEDFQNGQLAYYYESTLKNLPKGVNLILIHPAFDDTEMKEITIGHPNFGSAWRQIDHDYFISERCKTVLTENGIRLITWREIKNLIYPKLNG